MLIEIGLLPAPTPGSISYRNGVVAHTLTTLANMRIPAGTPRFGIELVGGVTDAGFLAAKPERMQRDARHLRDAYTAAKGVLDAYRSDQESGESLDDERAAFVKARAMLAQRGLEQDLARTLAGLFGVGSEHLTLRVTNDIDARGSRYEQATFSFSYATHDDAQMLRLSVSRGGRITGLLEELLLPQLARYARSHREAELAR